MATTINTTDLDMGVEYGIMGKLKFALVCITLSGFGMATLLTAVWVFEMMFGGIISDSFSYALFE